jgi:hypothetical protein
MIARGDAADFILALPRRYGERNSWKHAIELLMDAAENGGSVELATKQLETALFLEARWLLRSHAVGAKLDVVSIDDGCHSAGKLGSITSRDGGDPENRKYCDLQEPHRHSERPP